MHELSVTQGVLDVVLEKAKETHVSKITAINLVIGDMSSIVDDCVQFYFDFLSKATIAEGAALSFRRVPTQLKCRSCGFIFSLGKSSWSCPQCGEWDVEIVSGQEFYIESMEVD